MQQNNTQARGQPQEKGQPQGQPRLLINKAISIADAMLQKLNQALINHQQNNHHQPCQQHQNYHCKNQAAISRM